MKNFIFSIILVLTVIFKLDAQPGFTSTTNLNPVSISANTGEKPQAKVWTYAGKHWAVLANSSGTYLWRLDGTSWTSVLKISNKNTTKADTKVVGSTVHILLFQGISSQLVSAEYSLAQGTYQLWSKRPSTVNINLLSTVEIANFDIDGNGRMWIAYDGSTEIYVSWSDTPYQNWSAPILVATGISTDDIGAVIALPGKIGVFWSNQNTKRFGFKTHTDGANPSSWSNDEVPASQSALNIGNGMADDHMNMAVSSNGTLYCAVKTSYDTSNYPTVALLVRRTNGNWDNLYEVSKQGTRPIVVLNEVMNKVRVVYTQITGNGNIVYNESPINNISFGNQLGLISGSYNNPTSTKDNFTSEVVILASNSSQAVGVLARDGISAPNAPLLSSPEDLAANVSVSPTLSWQSSMGANSYKVQVSSDANFSTMVFDQSGITGTQVTVSGLANSTTYYWRARATNTVGDSDWSDVRSFTTEAAPVLASIPQLLAPPDVAINVSVSPSLSWQSSVSADSYRVQVSSGANFSTMVFDQSGITGTQVSVSGLANSTTYYWRARATNTVGDSDWSAVRSFTTEAAPVLASIPQLLAPPDVAINVSVSPSLSWQSSVGADSYKVQVSSEANFSTMAFDQVGIPGTSVTVPNLVNATSYYWRARATNAVGDSDWSAIRSFTTSPATQSGSLVAHWKMDEGSGTLLLDASDYGNNASTTGNPTRVAGVIGQALRFNGTSQIATAADKASLDLTGAITIATWIRPEKKGTQYLVKKAEQNVTDGYELSLASNGKLFFRFNQKSSGDTYRLNSITSYPTNGSTWMHVAVTYDGTTIRMYLDGVENSTKTFSLAPPILINGLALTLGAENNGYRGLQGAMDDTRIYNTALSASEILELTSFSASVKNASVVFDVPFVEKYQEEKIQNKFFAYPNPFTDRLILGFSLSTAGEYSIALYDNRGAKISDLGQGVSVADEQNTVEVDGSGLSTGLYLVRLQTNKGETRTLRLIRR